jgi:hypothetical protein
LEILSLREEIKIMEEAINIMGEVIKIMEEEVSIAGIMGIWISLQEVANVTIVMYGLMVGANNRKIVELILTGQVVDVHATMVTQ